MDTKIEKRLLKIVNDYFICKNHFRLLTFSNGHPDYDSPFYQYYRDVELTFLKLDKDEQIIIRYEYFFPMNDPETVLLIDAWENQESIDAHHASPMMQTIMDLREKYDLHMRAERFVSDEMPKSDKGFIRS